MAHDKRKADLREDQLEDEEKNWYDPEMSEESDSLEGDTGEVDKDERGVKGGRAMSYPDDDDNIADEILDELEDEE